MKVQLSVVIATSRRPELLIRCLRALSRQRLNRDTYEIVVVSDGPDTLTAKTIAAFQQDHTVLLCYIAMPVKKGPAAARNLGWLAAKGELIVFTDDDCIPGENWLSAYYQEYRTDRLRAFTGKTVVPVPEHPTDYERNVAGLETADFITANCACPKELLAAIGGFDEQFAMAWREDSELQFKLIKAGIPIMKLTGAVVVHPVRKANWGISLKEQKKTMYNALLYKKHPRLYRKKIQPEPPVCYYAVLASFICMLTGLIARINLLFAVGLLLWLCLSMLFAYYRLKFTSREPRHLIEMAATSVLIPFLSLYWQFYGAIKFRVLFI